MRCQKCGTENPAGQSYCGHCGAYLVVYEGAILAPYETIYSVHMVSREHPYAFYGFLLGFLVIMAVALIYLSFLTEIEVLLAMGVLLILLVFFLYGFVVRDRIRDLQSEKRKGV